MDSGNRDFQPDFQIEGLLRETGIIVIDQSRLFREGMKRLIENTNFRIVAEARCLDEVMPDLQRPPTAPRLLIVKWCEDDPEFLRSIIALNSMSGAYRIVAINDRVESNGLITALRAGVQAFLLKDLSPDALIQSLRLVELGETVFPTELAALLISGQVAFSQRDSSAAAEAAASMSDRELSILRCLVRGEPNKVIAFQLKVAESTVKVQMKVLFKKIDAANRTQAAIWAMDHGLDRVVDDGSESKSDYNTGAPVANGAIVAGHG